MGVIINGAMNIGSGRTLISSPPTPPQTFANYSLQLGNGLLQVDTIISISGIQFAPSATNITIPPELVGFPNDAVIYTGTGPTVSNVSITLTLNKGTVEFTSGNTGNVFYSKNGVDQPPGISVSVAPDSYILNVTSNENDNILFIVSTFND